MSSSTPFLPATLPLLPLPQPHLLYPFLSIQYTLPAGSVAVVLQSINENIRKHKLHDADTAGGVERIVGVVPVLEIERRVTRWATAARIKRIVRSKDDPNSLTLTLEGLARIRLPRSLPPVLSILPGISLYTSTYSLPLPILTVPSAPDIYTPAAKLLPEQIHERMREMPVGLLADVLATVLGFEWEMKVEILGLIDVPERVTRVKEILEEMIIKREGGSGTITPKSDLPPAPQSKALVRRKPSQPPSSSAGAPNGVPDDLQPLYSLLSTRTPELTGNAYHTINRELARLGKIPPQSAEYGVAKTYLELLLSLPWKKVSEDQSVDLKVARERLEDEHEGLEEVKRRVVEYLAVYRLKKQLFNEEEAKQISLKSSSPIGENKIDNSTASELLELIPSDERASAEAPLPPVMEDGPPTGIYRDKGPILLLVGPPGVGKTSIAKSLANCLGRRFHRISLGGVRDEAEIRGHRRTYVGALPGLPVQALRKVGVSNPVILLDELDKISTNSFHGDPSAALLEALDPAQNWGFHDHYLGDVPIDLSQVMFIATANSLDTIPAPLLDRCEVIECGGYVMDEKVKIAGRFLIKKQISENGLRDELIDLKEDGIRRVIEDYTRESGVRSLEREIAKLIRSKAVEYSQSLHPSSATLAYKPEISLADIQRILGLPRYESELREQTAKPGVVHGLSYQGSGMGGVLVLEAVTVPSSKSGVGLKCTGRLGEVIQESAELALTWVKSNSEMLGLEDKMKGVDIHLHLPSGAVKKDGPSAGIAMVVSFVSLLSGREVPPTTAMTGEITLRGTVTAVGGIKEKVLGAHRAGIRRIIMSERNRKDVIADVPESVKTDIEFRFVKTIVDALDVIWEGEPKTGSLVKSHGRPEARL